MIAQRVEKIRSLMKKHGLHAYVVPGTDEHQNEYVPDCGRRMEWISGFAGSAGTVVITPEMAGLWTDGRYHLQAREELDAGVFTLYPVGLAGVEGFEDWLAREIPRQGVVGVDPKLITVERARGLKKKLESTGKSLWFVEENLVDRIWKGRPSQPVAPIHVLPERYSGETAISKLSRVREEMARHGADVLVVSTLDGIAWLFNVRGKDIPYNPVFLSYAVIFAQRADLFLNPEKVTEEARDALAGVVDFHEYSQIRDELKRCARQGLRVWVDPGETSFWIYDLIRGAASSVEEKSPVARLKAVKNRIQLEGMKACHIRDGLALVRFLYWIEKRVPFGGLTELAAARALDEFRAKMAHFQGPSFETIVGFGEHAAVIHYAPSERTDREIRPDGLLLVDSGGHYLDGTTDVTRTVALGIPTPEQRDRFTRVLKGHIQLATAKFPKGTPGRQLDTLARRPLWEVGLNYLHGTGHGIGSYLNVHEGPHSISPRDPGVSLEPGMAVTNEPGYYKEGAYGIRTESVMLVRPDDSMAPEQGEFCCFETVTLVPIDLRLVEPAMLDDKERRWLNSYHQKVREMLAPHLSEEERLWLAEATRPV